jgi:phosphoribosylformylglycinamidine synthase
MFALNLVYPEYPDTPEMQRNESDKFESSFLGVRVKETRSVMLKPLIGTELGIWVAHGEGRFTFPRGEEAYDIALRFVSADYPANPNGSQFNAAGVVSKNGRHLAMMPHLERSIFSWQWAYLPTAMPRFEVSPWALAFIAAREWIEGK